MTDVLYYMISNKSTSKLYASLIGSRAFVSTELFQKETQVQNENRM